MDNLLGHAEKFTHYGLPLIPTKNKSPIEKWADRRYRCATDDELRGWFSNGKADGIAIPINNREFALDTDGTCESLFLKKVVARLPQELQELVKKTTHTKTPNGHHRLFKITQDFPDGIKAKVYVKLNGHNEIALKGKGHYLIERGPRYEIVNDIESLVTLRKEQVEELLRALEAVKVETHGSKTIIGIILPYYTNGRRDNVVFALSGYLHKNGVSKEFILDTIESLAYQVNDEELQARIRVVSETCSKDAQSDQVSGYSRLVEALDNNQDAIESLEQVLRELGQGTFASKRKRLSQIGEVEKILPADILLELTPHIYKLISYNPLTFVVADQNRKEIIKSIIATPKKTWDSNNKFTTKAATNTETTTITTIMTAQRYMPKNVIIDAIPTKVVINDNPLDGNKTFQVSFTYKASKRPFTLGPGTPKFIVEELQNRGRYVSKDAVEALSAILTIYEDNDIAEINNKIPCPGYYYIDGKIVGYDINQRLDLDPRNNEQDKKAVLECIDALEGFQIRSKKKVAFPTVLKWGILAPFAFITKTQTAGVEDWLPWLYLYDTTDTGKTTLIINAVLAIWGKHDKQQNENHFRGPGSIDTPSKFGITISQTTYPILVDEVGGLLNDDSRRDTILLDMVKYSVQGKHARLRFHENILALSPLAFTSNDPPPQDSAYRRRFVAIQYYENEKWTEAEKNEFKRWLTNEEIRSKLETLGDFVARYVVEHPEIVLGYSSYSWNERAATILTEFWRSVDREPPEWIGLVAEQTIVQEVSEERQFEIRGFLQQAILEAYRRESFTNPDPSTLDSGGRRIYNTQVTFEQKINYCLNNKAVPFLHVCKRNIGQEIDVAITSNIRSELKRYDKLASVMTMNALASKIPGFEYGLRNVDGQRVRVICGPKSKFVSFLNCEVSET